jgi:hypothetical protein
MQYGDQNGKNPTRRQHRAVSGGVADWMSADPMLLTTVIAKISFSGGAIRLGYTSDGGAYAIGIYGDGAPYTDYVRPNEDINEYLQNLLKDYEQ